MDFWSWLLSSLRVVGMSMLPIVEVKGAIPFGINVLGLPPWECFWLAVCGALLPSPFIILFFRPIANFLRTHGPLQRAIRWAEAKARKKSDIVRRYRLLGLFIFVAIPLPGTGVWMGSLIAALMNIRLRKAVPVILLGNIAASLCMLALGMVVLQVQNS